MITEQTLMKFGFVEDGNGIQLKEVFKNNFKLHEVHLDIYPENPLASSASFMLLLRTNEKNVIVSNSDERLILAKSDKYKTQIINVLFSEIKECYCKDTYVTSEFVLNIQNIWYKITVFN